jgi:hypothetical protein
MNRRQFIQCGIVTIVATGGFPMFSSLSQLETVARENLHDNVAGLEADYIDILYLASLAPSGHNAQPWTVKLMNDHHWMIGTDSNRWLPVIDPENREALISIGAFLENLVVAANAKGYHVEYQIIAKNSKDKDIVEINLYKVGLPDTSDVKNIELRRTLRNNLLTDDLSREDIAFMIGKNKDDFHYFPRNTKEEQYLSEGTILANKLQTYQDSAQEELAKWVRWSNKDIRQFGNGLTTETMEIEGVARWYVKNFYSKQSVLEQSFREATIKKITEQVTNGSGWLLLTSMDSSVLELIDIGRKLQRMWLGIRERQIAIHPMNQLIEDVAMRGKLSSALGIAGDSQLLLRVGYIKNYPNPVSPRMSLQTIIV